MIKMVNRIILLTIFSLIIRGEGILLYLTSVSQGGGGGECVPLNGVWFFLGSRIVNRVC